MDRSSLNTYIGGIIREIRSKKNIPIQELAERTGMDRSSVSNIEKGNQGLSLYSFYLVVNALEVKDFSQFFPKYEDGESVFNKKLEDWKRMVD